MPSFIVFFLLVIKFQNSLVGSRDVQIISFLSSLELRIVLWPGSDQSE